MIFLPRPTWWILVAKPSLVEREYCSAWGGLEGLAPGQLRACSWGVQGSNGLNSGQAERPQVSIVSARCLLVTSLVGPAFWVELLDVLCVRIGVPGPRAAYLPRL